jgi:hypothetical protein
MQLGSPANVKKSGSWQKFKKKVLRKESPKHRFSQLISSVLNTKAALERFEQKVRFAFAERERTAKPCKSNVPKGREVT